VDNTDYAWPSPTAFSKRKYGPANNLNQYPSVQGVVQGYDDNGNLTSGVITATFDVLNRMTQATLGGTTVDFIYDPNNRQAQKSVSSVDTGYLYDGVQMIAEYDGSTLEKRYIPGPNVDETFVIVQSSTKTYLHMDRLGSVIALTDDTGAVLNSFKYGAFGETPSLSGTPFGYTGQRYDSELQAYYFKARYYSPVLGRFVSPDPIGFNAGDMNLYAYTGNNAINMTDPAGTIGADLLSNKPSLVELLIMQVIYSIIANAIANALAAAYQAAARRAWEGMWKALGDMTRPQAAYGDELWNVQGPVTPYNPNGAPIKDLSGNFSDFNCFGFALGDLEFVSRKDAASRLSNAKLFTAVPVNAQAMLGDIVTYQNSEGLLLHAAVVAQVDQYGAITAVVSKRSEWGPLMSHQPLAPKVTNTFGRNIQVFRPNY
jgi:RHS repeat-associated protein